MGLYFQDIGVSKQDKVDWLMGHTWFKRITHDNDNVRFDFDHHAGLNRRVICAVDNGAFIAVAVAYSKAELEVFLKPDGRDKLWFVADLQTIKEKTIWEDYKDYL